MTTSNRCDSCGERERVRHLDGGECRECRGVDVADPPRTGYVSPDALERHGDAIAQGEQEARHRTIANTRHGDGGTRE